MPSAHNARIENDPLLELAQTILENLTKMDGWAHFTGNRPVLGRGSVAELMGYQFAEHVWWAG